MKLHTLAAGLRTKFVLVGRVIEEPNRVEIDAWHRGLTDKEVVENYLESSFDPWCRMPLSLAITVAAMSRSLDEFMQILEG
jgi:hypothetical protein